MPFVSIIIPAFNMEKYITEALDSVVRQTFGDYEAIIIDDGSTDKTPELVQRYLKDNRFKLIRQENQGSSAARNAGIMASSGEWIAFLDADDFWAAEKLYKQVGLIGQYPDAGLIFCNGTEFNEAGEIGPFYKRVKKFPDGDILHRLMHGNCLWVCSVMVKRKDIEDIGMFVRGMYAEDYDMWLKILQRGGKARGVWERLCYYRVRHGSLRSKRRETYESTLRVYEWALERSEDETHRQIVSDSLRRTRSDIHMLDARLALFGKSKDVLKFIEHLYKAWREYPQRTRPLEIMLLNALGQKGRVEKAFARKW